jgi:tRNA A37 threonylcarbamoyladenosine synthetase subunit TsaC/SUA5/YrdC
VQGQFHTRISNQVVSPLTFVHEVAHWRVPRLKVTREEYELEKRIPANAAVLSLSASYGPLGSAGGHVDVLYPLLKPQPVAEVKP